MAADEVDVTFGEKPSAEAFIKIADPAAGASLDVSQPIPVSGTGGGLHEGNLVVLSERGKLVTADANPFSFKELGSLQILSGRCWTSPSIANGRLYARNQDGDMVCVDLKQ